MTEGTRPYVYCGDPIHPTPRDTPHIELRKIELHLQALLLRLAKVRESVEISDGIPCTLCGKRL